MAAVAWPRPAASVPRVEPLGAKGGSAAASGSCASRHQRSPGRRDVAIVMPEQRSGLRRSAVRRGRYRPVPAEAACAGATLVVMSSIPVETARAQAARVSGAAACDTSMHRMSGGESGARDGTLAIMAGGEVQAVARRCAGAHPLAGSRIADRPESGQLAKLANQIIVGGTLVAIAEALELVRRGGADPAAVAQAWMGGFADRRCWRVLGEADGQRRFRAGQPGRVSAQGHAHAEGRLPARSACACGECCESVMRAVRRRWRFRGEGDRETLDRRAAKCRDAQRHKGQEGGHVREDHAARSTRQGPDRHLTRPESTTRSRRRWPSRSRRSAAKWTAATRFAS